MTEKDVYEYNLESEERETILRLSIVDNNISMIIKDNTGNESYTALMTLAELKDVCKAFDSTNNLREAIILLNNTIEAGNIFLTEDEQGTSIDLKFNISLASGKFPPFTVNLVKESPLNENNVEEGPTQYAEQIEAKAKYGETKYSKPIVQENVKKPIVRTEYLKPIVQVKMPDGTMKTEPYEGKLPTGNEKTTESNYSYMTTPVSNNNYSLQNIYSNIVNQQNSYNDNPMSKSLSFYNTYTSPTNQVFSLGENLITSQNQNNLYASFTPSNNNMYTYNPSTNQYEQVGQYDQSNQYSQYGQYDQSNQYTQYDQSNQYTQYDQSNQYTQYGQSSAYTQYDQSNQYTQYDQSNQYTQYDQSNQYTQYNQYDQNNQYSQYNQYDQYNQYQNYVQPQSIEKGFAEVIPLGAHLETKILPPKIIYKNGNLNLNEQDNENEENQNQEEMANEDNEQEQEQEQEQDQDQEQEQEEGQEEGQEGEQEEGQEENMDDEQERLRREEEKEFETLYKTEEGLIIFRNGILNGIVHKYSEIDNVVEKIQKKLLKGAKFTLLYKASTHGDKASVFHEKCDNHQMTLVIVETDKGVRFGGFTTKTWEGHCIKKIDNDAFVFSLDKNEIYDIIRQEPAIGCYPKFGPVFFGCQIRIYDNFFTKGGTTCLQGLNYKTNKDYELNNGEQKFIVKDIEVYDIEGIDV